MVKETVVRIIDDIDGSAPAETVAFGYRGTSYSIDLSESNAQALAGVFQPYISSGRRERVASPKAAKAVATGSKISLDEVRDWAKKNGHQVADRGRIAGSIMHAFTAASKGSPGPAVSPPAPESSVPDTLTSDPSPTPTLDEIRAWATRNGHKVAGRGRIAHSIVDAFHSAAKAAGNVLSPEPEAEVTPPVKKVTRKRAAPVKAAKTTAKKAPAKRTTARKRASSAAPDASSATSEAGVDSNLDLSAAD